MTFFLFSLTITFVPVYALVFTQRLLRWGSSCLSYLQTQARRSKMTTARSLGVHGSVRFVFVFVFGLSVVYVCLRLRLRLRLYSLAVFRCVFICVFRDVHLCWEFRCLFDEATTLLLCLSIRPFFLFFFLLGAVFCGGEAIDAFFFFFPSSSSILSTTPLPFPCCFSWLGTWP